MGLLKSLSGLLGLVEIKKRGFRPAWLVVELRDPVSYSVSQDSANDRLFFPDLCFQPRLKIFSGCNVVSSFTQDSEGIYYVLLKFVCHCFASVSVNCVCHVLKYTHRIELVQRPHPENLENYQNIN